MDKQRLLERFLSYVQVDTTANESTTEYPSSAGQWELGKQLVAELQQMGYEDAHQDEHALVWVTIPSTLSQDSPTIAFNAHLDTSPETTGKNVQPQVIEAYEGGDISLPASPDRIIRVSENPELDSLVGKTIVTTDGTTLLGGDDKAGVAIMMQLAETLAVNPGIPHGPIKLLFTCDEEIGRGIDHVDFNKLGATACYTLDGGGANDIDVETFSADMAIVTVTGVNIHPSIGKDRLVNAVRAAADFLERLPKDLSPERTDDREGFVHPYHVEGGVAEVTIRLILRDFDTPRLSEYATLLSNVAQEVMTSWKWTTIDVEIKKQYRNLGDGLRAEPRAAGYAKIAHQRLDRPYRTSIIRGGTDGSQMTERGLPTPNLSSGQHNPHSPLEWACLDEMLAAGEVCLELIQVWSEQPALDSAE